MPKRNSYETLDSEDWNEMRALAHRMVDDAITYLETVRERPVWKPVPDDVAARFDFPAADQPAGADAVYQEFLENIFPYPMGQYSSSILGLVYGQRNGFRRSIGFHGRDPESQRWWGQSCRQFGRGAGRQLDEGDAGLPAGFKRTAGQWWLYGQPCRHRRCPKYSSRVQCSRAWSESSSTTLHGVCLYGNSQLRLQPTASHARSNAAKAGETCAPNQGVVSYPREYIFMT
jgi:hypothetical protein